VLDTKPEGWEYIRSESGWMNGPALLVWARLFHKVLVRQDKLDQEGNRQKVILFLDGYSAHLDAAFSSFCEEHGIVLFCLIANSTHILQPVDVGISAPLKRYWCKAVQSHKLSSSDRVTKHNVGDKLREAFSRVSSETIKNAFRYYFIDTPLFLIIIVLIICNKFIAFI
jgi:hypothetical protein